MVRANGGIEEVELRRPGCSEAWDAALDPPLRAAGAIREGKVGAARLLLMRARAVVEVTAELLRAGPEALLCDDPQCEACNIARRMLDKQ